MPNQILRALKDSVVELEQAKRAFSFPSAGGLK